MALAIASTASFTTSQTGGGAIANYGEGTWQFKVPYSQGGGGGLMRFDDIELGQYLSPAGNVYVLAAVFDGTSASVASRMTKSLP